LSNGNILEAIKVSKAYPGVQALDAVDFELRRGEVQALVGQNGAGKSTFIEIIAGSLRADSGQIVLEGSSYGQLDPSKSIELGVQTVHQENQLVEELSVAENIYLYDLPRTALGFIRYGDCERAAEALFEELGVAIPADEKLSRLTFIEKKLVSIAKACSRKAKILILDEPTASLDEHGKNILFDLIRRNTQKGLSVIYISHNLGEIFEVCDRVTVFKDGKLVATHAVNEVSMGDIVREMIGSTSTSLYTRTKMPPAGTERPALEIQDFSRDGVVEHVSFGVRRGEIFGIAGLVGAGRTELARMIFGLDPRDSGRVLYEGADITPRDPYDAIQKGIGYLTEDRKDNGLMLGRPIYENISLARFAKSDSPVMDLPRERTETAEISRQLDVKTPSISQLVVNLSGGNQQKVVMAKWLYAGSEVLIFDEPTVGVDVGAKTEIYRMMENLAREGKIIIMISSDNPELIAVCDRVAVMRDKRLVTILEGDDITEVNVLGYSMGVEQKE
jgi:ribose transport system ATP-binding protein